MDCTFFSALPIVRASRDGLRANSLLYPCLRCGSRLERHIGLRQLYQTVRPWCLVSSQVRSRETLPITDILGTIPYTFFAFSVGFSIGPSLQELHEARSINALLNYGHIIVLVAVLFASLFVIGLNRLSRHSDAGWFLFLWLGVPIIGAFAVASMTTYHVYNTRYVALALPAYLIILAAGLTSIRRAPVQIALFVGLLFVNGISLYNYYFDHQYARAVGPPRITSHRPLSPVT